MIWKLRTRSVDLSHSGLVMGVLNVTPDSFSDGGQFMDEEAAFRHAERMAGEGAVILDVGGESSRPGSEPVPVEEELRRVIPVVRRLRSRFPDLFLSIDTYKAETAHDRDDAPKFFFHRHRFRSRSRRFSAYVQDDGSFTGHSLGMPKCGFLVH